jgi:SAM-dependent methyltransferase
MALGLYDRIVLPRLIGCACGTRPIEKQRAKIVPLARGVVVDMGFGSGTNLPHYHASSVTKVIAVEPNPAMLTRGRENWRKDIVVEPIIAGAEATGLPDDCADTVVFTFSLCTIANAEKALHEARRVLREDGQVLFCEHGLAPDGDVVRWQRRLEPVWKVIAGGCHLTRDTSALFMQSGYQLREFQSIYLPGTPRFAGYNVWGIATPC